MKRIISLMLVIALCTSLASCSTFRLAPQRFTRTLTDYFDTVTTVIAYDTSQKAFDSKMETLEQWLSEYDQLFDIYHAYEGLNNLYTVNEQAGKAPVKTDRRIIDLLTYGKEAYTLTRGTVNICLGSVLRLWHQAREETLAAPENAHLPEKTALQEAALHTDIEQLIIDETASTVCLADAQASLDVGAVAKGFAAREICQEVKEQLWQDFVISIGGNVCTAGYKNGDGKSRWNVQVENPDPAADNALAVLHLTDKAVVTSGDYQRYFTVDGKNYCHIISPETLCPAEHFSGVTVICEDSALGDVLSTALFILPYEEGRALAEACGAEALWADKEYRVTYSSGFEELMQ